MQKIVLIILGIIIILGLGFFVVKSNNKIIKEENTGKSTEVSDTPAETSSKPEENPINIIVEFNQLITLRPNDKVSFSDGLNVLLKTMNDSRCPQGVQCIWAGELSGVFILSGGNFTASKEINLGIMNNKRIALEGYIFSLQNITENSATILVENKK
jgi:hypothetical protein